MGTVAVETLKDGLKALMKKRGRTYSELSEHLGVSLPTVKRILGPEELALSRLLEICEWLDVSLSDLETFADIESRKAADFFTPEQEEFLTANPGYLSYFAHLHSGEAPERIAKDYSLTAKSTELYLLRLEKIGLLRRDAKGRVRLVHRGFPNMIRDGQLVRSQYRQLIEKFSGFFTRRLSRAMTGGEEKGPTWMTMFSGRVSKKTARDWQEKYRELQQELDRQANLEEKLDVIEDECYFVLSHLHCSLEPGDAEIAVIKETMGRIVNL